MNFNVRNYLQRMDASNKCLKIINTPQKFTIDKWGKGLSHFFILLYLPVLPVQMSGRPEGCGSCGVIWDPDIQTVSLKKTHRFNVLKRPTWQYTLKQGKHANINFKMLILIEPIDWPVYNPFSASTQFFFQNSKQLLARKSMVSIETFHPRTNQAWPYRSWDQMRSSLLREIWP